MIELSVLYSNEPRVALSFKYRQTLQINSLNMQLTMNTVLAWAQWRNYFPTKQAIVSQEYNSITTKYLHFYFYHFLLAFH